ncbi:hypothetical protein ACJ72_00900 [Emergomyces africanus]|uniref:Uncharacterized protein n=1 Tax=Emergomyces africanus TaxID=1955775 RepID=A0A1B7P6S5_9EURO|nr:hypothetical protein ACJ72_00900 [Emergomyces africanus]
MASMTKWDTPSYKFDPQHRSCVGKITVIACPECNGSLRLKMPSTWVDSNNETIIWHNSHLDMVMEKFEAQRGVRRTIGTEGRHRE